MIVVFSCRYHKIDKVKQTAWLASTLIEIQYVCHDLEASLVLMERKR